MEYKMKENRRLGSFLLSLTCVYKRQKALKSSAPVPRSSHSHNISFTSLLGTCIFLCLNDVVKSLSQMSLSELLSRTLKTRLRLKISSCDKFDCGRICSLILGYGFCCGVLKYIIFIKKIFFPC